MKIIKTVFLLAVLTGACAGGPKFSDLLGKEWRLIEIRTESSSIIFDRNRLVAEGFGEIFTLNFDAERISGTGAPNRYFAPYEPGTDKDRTISVKPLAGTLMAPIVEPEKLKEQEFFDCLQNAYKWNINKGNLELSTKGPDGREAVMVFTLN
ncbi:MAG: META domain-containing protein [Treponema sp.]|jgi:heat shock protein HslJ|nr:META domain-containing protein [Treponema sp.]